MEDEEKPTIAELMLDQLEIADLVMVNKTDLVDEKKLSDVVGYVQGINPNSEVIISKYSKVDL
jgi:G3E family GTPase